ncbi:MAG: tetraacyldisaccharide 4'-kinase [Alphaproteobacteria bacterium]|nr:tetraacyldisaccharide 4'-kinase [Alphaproteobacteria bacterium]
MKTPKYWQSNSLISKILYPLGYIYGKLTQLRLRLKTPQKVEAKVICVGNITAGGTGKTPVSISIARLLETEMYHPFFVTRGYGGKLQNIMVNNKKHSAKEVGDEPLLLSKQAPVIVNANRYEGAKLAEKEGADVIIMDDGFQNPGLHKDISFLVFDGHYGIGNGKIIPAGPLRETFEDGVKRADALIIMGKDKHNLAQRSKLPVFFGHTEPAQTTMNSNNILAFAGIGHPQKFYHTLSSQGYNVVETIDFPDHHFYSKADLENIMAKAKKLNADIYTTSKDFVKIPPQFHKDINVLEIAVVWDKPEELTEFILSKMNSKKKS